MIPASMMITIFFNIRVPVWHNPVMRAFIVCNIPLLKRFGLPNNLASELKYFLSDFVFQVFILFVWTCILCKFSKIHQLLISLRASLRSFRSLASLSLVYNRHCFWLLLSFFLFLVKWTSNSLVLSIADWMIRFLFASYLFSI